MATLPLANSDGLVEVSEEDQVALILLGPYYLLGNGYPARIAIPHEYLHTLVAIRMGFVSEIDHKDRNKLNAKRNNLREATRSEQSVNTNIRVDNKSGYKCISWNRKARKWIVQVHRNGKSVFVGQWKDINEALRQRNAYFVRNNLQLIE